MILRLAFQRMVIMRKQPVQVAGYFLLPVTFVFLVVWFVQTGTQDIRVPIALVDEDRSEYSQIVIERVKLDSVVYIFLTNRQQAEQLLKRNKVDSIFVLQNGFQQKLLRGENGLVTIINSPTSIASGLICEVVASEVLRLSSNVLAANYVVDKLREMGLPANQELWQKAWQYTDSQWEPEPLMTITYKEVMTDKLLNTEHPWMVPMKTLKSCLLFALMFMAFLTSNWVNEERKDGIFVRVKSTNVKLSTYLIGNFLPFLFVWIIDICLVLILSVVFYHVPLGEMVRLFYTITVYAAFCWALGICLAIFIPSVARLQMVGLFLTLLTSLVGGGILPLSGVFAYADKLSIVTPQFWVLQSYVWKGIPLLLGTGGIVLFLSFRHLSKE